MMHLTGHLHALKHGLADLERMWKDEREIAALRVRHLDVIHHVCSASSNPHPLLLREAYLSLISLGDHLKHAEATESTRRT